MLPDIPREEHPERADLQREAERRVTDAVRELGINLDLERHPEVRERLVEIGTHFADSVDIAHIIQALHSGLGAAAGLADETPERTMRSAILHDIGKSGPAGERGAFHAAVRRLFRTPKKRFTAVVEGHAKSIREFMAEDGVENAADMEAALRESGIDPEKESILVFWRRHAGWTFDILKTQESADIDAETAAVAASHHLLDGQNPAGFDQESTDATLLARRELVEAIDKYQAFRVRGGATHPEAIAHMRRMTTDGKGHPTALTERFSKVVDVLEKSEAALAAILGK